MESALYGIYALVVFVSEILLVRCAHSFDFWYVNNSCVNTVRQHFPWSILYFFLILACILQFAQYLFVTFNFLANCNCQELPPPPPRLFEWTAYQEKRKNLFEYLNKE